MTPEEQICKARALLAKCNRATEAKRKEMRAVTEQFDKLSAASVKAAKKLTRLVWKYKLDEL